jgi:transcriptional regulator with XRE-family HTH domain
MHRSTIIKHFGATVQKLRFGLRISQEELAERTQLHRTYIADIERGARNPTLLTIKKLAQGLGISAADLLSEPNVILEERNAVVKKLCLILLLITVASARAGDLPTQTLPQNK